MSWRLRLTLLGVGAMNSPRYPPAGLLVAYRRQRVMLDGGPGAAPDGPLAAWLVTDEHAELIGPLRRLAGAHAVSPGVAGFERTGLCVAPHPVAHTNHPAYGYLIETADARVAWAPEFWTFPGWAAGVDLLFAEAAGWRRPIRFARGVGGHMAADAVAEAAARHGVRWLVFAHIGRPALRAIDAGQRPAFGEWGVPGHTYVLPTRGRSR
jgi:Beta-lactamase superfamily domain